MAKGSVIYNEFHTFKDPYTGKMLTRLTAPEQVNHHPYFYYKMITNDNRYLIYASERNEQRHLYRMDLRDGSAVQLTEGAGVHDFGCSLTSDDRYLIYCRDKQIIRLDMDTLDEEAFYESPDGWNPNPNPGLSSDDKYLVLVEMNENDVVPSNGDWSTFEPQWAIKPHCRIVYVDIERQTSHIVHEELNCWLGHPQLRPHDPSTVLFCHEGPGHLIDARLWLIQADGTNLRCAKTQTHDELITHEYWLADGSRFAFVYRHKDYELHESIRFMDPFTLEEEIWMDSSKYCHFISNYNNSNIVGDGQLSEQHFIYLIDVQQRREEKLCSHGTSWKPYGNTQDAHPHPAFAPDGSFIIFTSDMEGIPCIYKIDLN
ncbi:oligogalacturonate lyase family protein [Paenibacillus radicis (ex Xue et al. 2023)]|uniref:Oligogalacturonate lyase family protein n=1 Tax=Paenibacillus radicis (ex Xue et al. 2023) TaxID=2972489 RepID=A0ABT1YIT6_9BACL|nr:oligogalacturonate lyase family protein [Paenibacillus radicis (ex Xue et al. 2023)]MCR8633101.1 oligogalacturonate lyase family protein [Paenibacillus radicis (ex Xue et al. 2023)]